MTVNVPLIILQNVNSTHLPLLLYVIYFILAYIDRCLMSVLIKQLLLPLNSHTGHPLDIHGTTFATIAEINKRAESKPNQTCNPCMHR